MADDKCRGLLHGTADYASLEPLTNPYIAMLLRWFAHSIQYIGTLVLIIRPASHRFPLSIIYHVLGEIVLN